MKIEELKLLTQNVPWFSRLGEPDYRDDELLMLPNMEQWSQYTGLKENEPIPQVIQQGMQWLPTQRDSEDPVHGKSLEERAEALGKKPEILKVTLELFKLALVEMRDFNGHPLLRTGPHDFTEAAKGAALFAVRRAAFEILVDEPGFWCSLIAVYRAGHWPFGLLPDGRVVVL